MRCIAVLLLAAAVAGAGGKTFRLTLYQPSVVSGTELQPGQYRFSVEEGKLVIGNGKVRAEAAAKMETADRKYESTSVKYSERGGKFDMREIRIGGTTIRVVLAVQGESADSAAAVR